MNIEVVLTKRSEMEYLNVFHGMVVYCIDTKECFYVNENKFRGEISTNVVSVTTMEDLSNILSPILSRVYLVQETESLYKFTNKWTKISTIEEMEASLNNFIDYNPSILVNDNGKFIAPKTIDSSVYLRDGRSVMDALEKYEVVTTNVKAVYVEAELAQQKIFTIPYPVCGYDLKRNHVAVIIKGRVLNPEDYVISDSNLLLNSHVTSVAKGELVLFMFYYNLTMSTNDNAILTTKNYEDFSITTEKLCQNIRLKATNVVETPNRYFLTQDDKAKLEGVASGATNYEHPETHPASMIVEDNERMFISAKQLEELNNKAFIEEVYTKDEVKELIIEAYQTIVGSSPDALDTLQELASALGNDPEFATTITNQIATKVSKEDYNKDMVKLQSQLDGKVDIVDYIKSGIYGTPIKYTRAERDVYEFHFDDDNFNDYIDGMLVILKITLGNDKEVAVNINNLGDIPLLGPDGLELYKGDLVTDCMYTLRFNGGTRNFILQGKGGVKLKDTRCEYLAMDDIITKGDILDIIGDYVRKSIPRPRLTHSYSTIDSSLRCNGKMKVVALNDDNFIVVYQEDSLLKGVHCSTSGVVGTPVIFNVDCRDFTFELISNYTNRCVLTTLGSNNTVHTSIIDFDSQYNFNIGNGYPVFNNNHVSNLNTVAIGDNKIIVSYMIEGRTITNYLEIGSFDITALTTRDNVDYHLEAMYKLSDSQILVINRSGNIMTAWVMIVHSNTILYSTVTEITNILRNDINVTAIDDNTIYMDYTDSLDAFLYRQKFIIDYHGNIILEDPIVLTNDNDEKLDMLHDARSRYMKDMFVCISNYKKNTADKYNNKYINIAITNNDLEEIGDHNVLVGEYDVVNTTMLNDEDLCIVYNIDSKININIFKIKRIPDCIATSGNVKDRPVLVNRW